VRLFVCVCVCDWIPVNVCDVYCECVRVLCVVFMLCLV